MSTAAPRPKFTADAYLAWESDQRTRHEFFHGEVYAMAGSSPRHAKLTAEVAHALLSQLARRCGVTSPDQCVVFMSRQRYVYPDVTVVCGPPRFEGATLENPSLIVEVLSKATAEYDRGEKWLGYQTITSLQDYVLVAQATARIEHFRRTETGWAYTSAGPGERLTTASGAVLDVDAIYAGAFDWPGDDVALPPDAPEEAR